MKNNNVFSSVIYQKILYESIKMTMYNPPHPGEILKELYLQPLELNITAAADALNVSRQSLSELINGRAGISPQMAMKLAKAFNTTPELWINLQSKYDLWQVRNIDLKPVKRLIKRKSA